MRVVLDTNVLVSAALRPDGSCGELLRLAREGRLQLVTSPSLLSELWDVLRRPALRSRVPAGEARAFVESIRDNSEIHGDVPDPAQVSRDPNDDFVVALAEAAHAEALVSGDADLLEVARSSTRIVSPRRLLNELIDD